tara:strand:- start:2635 stop:3267 length:633 start_codon:yes stop_codon:yes gene_type:complete
MQVSIAVESKNLFANLLNQDSDDEDCNEKLCLITKQPLTYNSISLSCGHKFNYNPLLKEIIMQKNKSNPLNITHLCINEIQCPYCRKIHPQLLPYINSDTNPYTIKGVTAPKKYCMNLFPCEWTLKTGKQKGRKCGKSGYQTENGVYCCTHHKSIKPKEEFLSWNEEMEALKCLKIPQLKAILHENNLKKTGTKNTLISRIVTNKIPYTT